MSVQFDNLMISFHLLPDYLACIIKKKFLYILHLEDICHKKSRESAIVAFIVYLLESSEEHHVLLIVPCFALFLFHERYELKG